VQFKNCLVRLLLAGGMPGLGVVVGVVIEVKYASTPPGINENGQFDTLITLKMVILYLKVLTKYSLDTLRNTLIKNFLLLNELGSYTRLGLRSFRNLRSMA
jgi:hypothetical protein